MVNTSKLVLCIALAGLFLAATADDGKYGPIEDGDRPGNDIATLTNATTAQQCQNRCHSNSKCKAWTWDSCNKNRCWIKSSEGTHDAGVSCRKTGIVSSHGDNGSTGTGNGGNNGGNNNNNGGNNNGTSCLSKRLEDVKAGRVKVRGGNLGSWFIQEGWMVPQLWKNGCNQNSSPGTTLLEKCLGSAGAAIMQKHWSTFVTEDDFKLMAKYNLNAMRLPLGWWQIYDTVGGASKAGLKVTPTNYLTGALAYVDKAFEWGEKYGVGILIDMHAAPGSQNGDDHSAPPDNHVQNWDKYPANQDQTTVSMEMYAQRYGNKKALLGFCLMNEPKTSVPLLKKYYQAAYDRIRKHSPNSIIIINPLITNQNTDQAEWTQFMNSPQYTNVWMSMHWYHIWGFEGKSDSWKLNYIKNDRASQISNYMNKNPKKGIIDEWSNGGISDGNAAMQAQIAQFNKLDGGWTFWAWSKTSGGDNWSLRAAFEKGWIKPSQTGVSSC